MQNFLIVVDMQNDFVTGALGSADAQKIVDNVVSRVKEGQDLGEIIIFTRDTHGEDYLATQEGVKLPVKHCIKDSHGWQIIPELKGLASNKMIVDKPTFGSLELMQLIKKANETEPVGEVTLLGLCTDICVISNAMLIKNALPEITVKVDASCSAGVSKESHNNALNAMKVCQIEVVNE
jgi:nicotinamidase-related amidase